VAFRLEQASTVALLQPLHRVLEAGVSFTESVLDLAADVPRQSAAKATYYSSLYRTRLRNNLYCVGWGVMYSLTHSYQTRFPTWGLTTKNLGSYSG